MRGNRRALFIVVRRWNNAGRNHIEDGRGRGREGNEPKRTAATDKRERRDSGLGEDGRVSDQRGRREGTTWTRRFDFKLRVCGASDVGRGEDSS